MISSFLLSVCILMCVGALLHLAWGILRAALVWAPSGYAGIVAGWYVAQCSENAAMAVAAALGASTLRLQPSKYAPKKMRKFITSLRRSYVISRQ